MNHMTDIGESCTPADMTSKAAAEEIEPRCTVRAHTGTVKALLSFEDSDGPRVLSASSDRTIRMWDMRSNYDTPLKVLQGHDSAVYSLAHLGSRIASGGFDRSARVWNVSNGSTQQTAAVAQTHVSTVDAIIAYSEGFGCGDTVVSCSGTEMRIWDIDSGHLVAALRMESRVLGLHSFCVDGATCLFCACSDNLLRLYDPCLLGQSGAAPEPLQLFKGHGAPVAAVSSGRADDSPPARPGDCRKLPYLISGSEDGTCRVWNLATSETATTLRGHTAEVNAVANFALPSMGGALGSWRLVSGSEDRTLRLWDPSQGAALLLLRGHSSPVLAVACAVLDGRAEIVSGGEDNTLRLWRPETESLCAQASSEFRRLACGACGTHVGWMEASAGAAPEVWCDACHANGSRSLRRAEKRHRDD